MLGKLTAVLLVVCTLLAGCGGDDAGEGGGGSDGGDAEQPELTAEDMSAFKEAAAEGTAEGPEYVDCIATHVEAGVESGEITAQDVHDWIEGEAPTGAVQDYISAPGRVAECVQVSSGEDAGG